MNVELANLTDEQILNEVLNEEKYEWIKSYDIHVKMFYKYGKYDKDGNLKSPALKKNGIAIPLCLKIVSSFNRLTDDVEVKIIINKDIWDEYTQDEKKASLDNVLSYLEVKTDKIGEPIPISEDNDKVQLKMKHPDFYCEGFIEMIRLYGKNYIPLQEAYAITKILERSTIDKANEVIKEADSLLDLTKEKIKRSNKKLYGDENKIQDESNLESEDEDEDINLDDIKI